MIIGVIAYLIAYNYLDQVTTPTNQEHSKHFQNLLLCSIVYTYQLLLLQYQGNQGQNGYLISVDLLLAQTTNHHGDDTCDTKYYINTILSYYSLLPTLALDSCNQNYQLYRLCLPMCHPLTKFVTIGCRVGCKIKQLIYYKASMPL